MSPVLRSGSALAEWKERSHRATPGAGPRKSSIRGRLRFCLPSVPSVRREMQPLHLLAYDMISNNLSAFAQSPSLCYDMRPGCRPTARRACKCGAPDLVTRSPRRTILEIAVIEIFSLRIGKESQIMHHYRNSTPKKFRSSQGFSQTKRLAQKYLQDTVIAMTYLYTATDAAQYSTYIAHMPSASIAWPVMYAD